MNIEEKRKIVTRNFTENFSADEIIEMMMEHYTDQDIEASYEIFNGVI
jgi:uncharacterized protein (DUF1800 family)